MREREAADVATAEPTATRAMSAPGPARLLQLQRTAGNRAVGRVLARYEAGEHIQFDTLGHNVPVAGLSGIDERYIVAMGDYYKSPEAFMNAKADELKELIALHRSRREGAHREGRHEPDRGRVAEVEREVAPEGRALHGSQQDQRSHFAPRNKARWEELHKQASRRPRPRATGAGWSPARRGSSTRSPRTT